MTKLYKISYSECELWLLIQNVKIPIDFSNSVLPRDPPTLSSKETLPSLQNSIRDVIQAQKISPL